MVLDLKAHLRIFGCRRQLIETHTDRLRPYSGRWFIKTFLQFRRNFCHPKCFESRTLFEQDLWMTAGPVWSIRVADRDGSTREAKSKIAAPQPFWYKPKRSRAAALLQNVCFAVGRMAQQTHKTRLCCQRKRLCWPAQEQSLEVILEIWLCHKVFFLFLRTVPA